MQKYLEVKPEQVRGAVAALSMLSHAGERYVENLHDSTIHKATELSENQPETFVWVRMKLNFSVHVSLPRWSDTSNFPRTSRNLNFWRHFFWRKSIPFLASCTCGCACGYDCLLGDDCPFQKSLKVLKTPYKPLPTPPHTSANEPMTTYALTLYQSALSRFAKTATANTPLNNTGWQHQREEVFSWTGYTHKLFRFAILFFAGFLQYFKPR